MAETRFISAVCTGGLCCLIIGLASILGTFLFLQLLLQITNSHENFFQCEFCLEVDFFFPWPWALLLLRASVTWSLGFCRERPIKLCPDIKRELPHTSTECPLAEWVPSNIPSRQAWLLWNSKCVFLHALQSFGKGSISLKCTARSF